MIKEKLQDAFNQHINAEIYSAYLYYSMATYFDDLSLKGFARWMRIQALEEMTHAHKFIAFMGDRGGHVKMAAIDAPPANWESPLAVSQAVYEHEVHVSDLINKLMDLAHAERDHAAVSFLNWFVDEQVEEEASADEVVQRLKLVEKTEGGIFMLDKEMDARTFVLPPFLSGAF